MVNTILAKRVNHIVAKGDHPVWPKGSKSHGFSTMQVSQDVFRFVPLQDFTSLSDIDWNKSILEIDNQFSAKYHLSNEEIAFVESMIKPM